MNDFVSTTFLSGFTFARNAQQYDYPLQECLLTLLQLCDEVIIAVGESEDSTLDMIKTMPDCRLKIIPSTWDLALGYKVLSQQTNLAMQHCTGAWGLYLQSDEIIHEKYFKILRAEIEKAHPNNLIEGLLLQYKHFYGSYHLYNAGRKYYRNEVRVIRLGTNIASYDDAKGFRCNGEKLAVRSLPVEVYHYGYARIPDIMKKKRYDFHKLWHRENEIKKIVAKQPSSYDIENNYNLLQFNETHPAVMKERIEKSAWSEKNYQIYLESMKNRNLKNFAYQLAALVEQKTWQFGYNKPYRKLVN
jgi:Glycosyl transferase family 2